VTTLEKIGSAAEIPTLRTSAILLSQNLKDAGWDMTELYGKDNSYSNIIENLKNSLLCYIGNHGILLYIRCGEKCLGALDLPTLPPVQIYCFSCITTRTTGLWLSTNDIDWEYVDVPLERNVPLNAIRQGASSFLGMLMCGFEVEGDVLISEVLKNMIFFGHTLGEAIKEAKNTLTASVKASLMAMEGESLGNYQLSRYYNRFTVYECELYGDPDMKLPVKRQKDNYAYIQIEDDNKGTKEISINIPPGVWKEIELPVGEKSQKMYYTRNYRTFYPKTPHSVLAGSMPVDKDPENHIARENIGYYNFKIKTEIPKGHTVKYIELKDVKLLDAYNFNGNKLEGVDPYKIFGKGRIRTSLFKDAEEVDILSNWPFTLEKDVDNEILWFFIPTSMVAEKEKIIARLASARFLIHYCKGVTVRGRINSPDGTPPDAFITFISSERKKRRIDTDLSGNYSLSLPSGKYSLLVEADLHVSYREDIFIPESDMVKNISLSLKETYPVTLKVQDSVTDKPISSATVRLSILFGPRDRKMIEEYIKGKERYPHRFVKKLVTDENGKIEDNLPMGDYLVDIFKKKESGRGAIYLRKEDLLEVRKRHKENIYTLEPAGTVFGCILAEDTEEGLPDATVIVKISTGTEGKEKTLRFHTDMKGSFGAVVPADHKFRVLGIFEGYEPGEENNKGEGILLHRGETAEVKLICKNKK